jgi:voltage-gated potassium channel
MNKQELNEQRKELLYQIDELLDFPLVLLSILWLILIIIEFASGLPPTLQ